MLSAKDFENILSKPESSVLDFKRENYKLINDTDNTNTAKFVKDIISFANTVRMEPAYIIIGVEAQPDNTKNLIGIDQHIDDATMQDKVKDKVFPRPEFNYYPLPYQQRIFGIVEIPVVKYQSPICAIVKMKGLEVGRMYYRKGSANVEANMHEIIAVNNWLSTLPESTGSKTLQDQVTDIIKRVTSSKEKLSVIMTDIWNLSRTYKLGSLEKFAEGELKGVELDGTYTEDPQYMYRTQNVMSSFEKIELNPYIGYTGQHVRDQMEKDKAFIKVRLLFPESLTVIEDVLESVSKNTLGTKTVSSKKYLPKSGVETDRPIYLYMFDQTYQNLYKSIRQKMLDKMIEVS